MTKAQARDYLLAIATAIIEAVNAAGPMGAPGGSIYAALMPLGCRLEHYEAIMSALVKAGKVRKAGQCYFPV